VETTTQGTANINEVQKVHVNNATSGTYKLFFGANASQDIPFDAPDTIANETVQHPVSVQRALQATTGINAVSVSLTTVGNDRTYTVTFTNPGKTNVAQLVGDATNLKGPGKNGILSGSASIADVKVVYNPAIAAITTQQGSSSPATNEQQT